MIYPTDEVLVNWNLFQKFKFFILAAFLCVWLGTGVRAYASNTYDKEQVSFDSFSWFLGSTTTNRINKDSYGDVSIPVYLQLRFSGSQYQYFSGFLVLSGAINFTISFPDSNGNVSAMWFENAANEGIDIRYNLNNPSNVFIFFDNWLCQDSVGILVGYLHCSIYSSYDYVTLSFANQNQRLNYSSGIVYRSSSEYGLVSAIVYAINNSSDIDTVIDYLYIIKNNIPLINDVLFELESQSTILNTLSSKLTLIYNKDVELYNLLYNYINNSNSGASAASQAAADLAGAAADQHAIEASLAALSPGNMSDLDSADGLAVLENVTNATRFWSTLVTQFSEVSGILWGVFIIALLLGLIAFILRLR